MVPIGSPHDRIVIDGFGLAFSGCRLSDGSCVLVGIQSAVFVTTEEALRGFAVY